MSGPPRSLTPEQEALVRSSTVSARLAKKYAARTSVMTEKEIHSIGYEVECETAITWDANRNIPFEAYAYRPVRRRMWRAIREEKEHLARERPGLDTAYDHLERMKDPGDLFADTPAESRQHCDDLVAGVLGSFLEQLLASASRAPSEAELHEHVEHERRRAKVRAVAETMGDDGKIILLRSCEGLGWEAVAERMGDSESAVRHRHDMAVKKLARMLKKR